MPRCLIAKKWKAYPWLDRTEDNTSQQQQHQSATNSSRDLEELHLKSRRSTLDEDEEIDVVGDKFLIKLEKQRTTADAAAATAAAAAATSSEAATSHSSSSSSNMEAATTTTSKCWGPSSPTAGTTAPSPPPHSPEAATRVAGNVYNGKFAPGKVGKVQGELGNRKIQRGRT